MSGAVLAPATEAELSAAIAAAAAAGEPLAIEGNGTKRAFLRPVQAARTLSTRGLSGITLYSPSEMIVSAWAGTPLPEIEAALAEKGQHLIAEPPSFGALFGATLPPTIGGLLSTNLSGPRRITGGAMRDHVMGIRAAGGTGEIFRSGGRVLKNVTGLDLCKLLAGAHGTLGVITEVTLKVLPGPASSGTVAVRVADLAAGVRVLSAGLGSPFGVSGAALLPHGAAGRPGPLALLRIEEFSEVGRLPDGAAARRLGRAGRGRHHRGRRKPRPLGGGAGGRAARRDARGSDLARLRPPHRGAGGRGRRRAGQGAARLGRRAGLAGRAGDAGSPRQGGRRRRGRRVAPSPCSVRRSRCAPRSRCCRRSRRRWRRSAGG